MSEKLTASADAMLVPHWHERRSDSDGVSVEAMRRPGEAIF